MHIRKTKKSSGFTMVEVIIVLALFATFAFFLSWLASYQFQIYNNQSAQLSVTNDGRNAADDIDNYVRQAHRVLSSYSSYTTGAQTLVLQIPAVNSSGQTVSATYDTVVFYLTGTDFYRQVFPNAGSSRLAVIRKLASNIDTANFSITYNNASYDLATQVTSNIAVKKTVASQIKSITFSSQATLRNY